MKYRAFTLIETMIVIAFGVCMMTALGVLIYNFNTISTYQKTFSQSSNSASALMREIEALIIPAKSVLQTHTFSSATYSSSSTVLVLEIPSVDNSGNVIANTYDYAVFYTTGADAYRVLEANAFSSRVSGIKKLSSTVSALIFTYNDVNFTNVHTVTADVQTEAQAKQETLSDHRREQIRLRNH